MVAPPLAAAPEIPAGIDDIQVIKAPFVALVMFTCWDAFPEQMVWFGNEKVTSATGFTQTFKVALVPGQAPPFGPGATGVIK